MDRRCFDVVLESRELRLNERDWAPPSIIVLRLAWVPAPDSAVSPYDHLEGEVGKATNDASDESPQPGFPPTSAARSWN